MEKPGNALSLDVDYLVRKLLERQGIGSRLPKRRAIQEKVLRSTIRNDIQGKPHVFRVEVINTLDCNARCRHCSNHKLSEDRKRMPRATLEKVLERCVEHGTPTVKLKGYLYVFRRSS